MRLTWIAIAVLAYQAHRTAIVVTVPAPPPPIVVVPAPTPVRPDHLVRCTCNNECGWCGPGTRWMLVEDPGL